MEGRSPPPPVHYGWFWGFYFKKYSRQISILKTGHLKRRQKHIKKVIIKKFTKQFYLFTCILPTFCPHQTPVNLRQPTGLRQSNIRMKQRKSIWAIYLGFIVSDLLKTFLHDIAFLLNLMLFQYLDYNTKESILDMSYQVYLQCWAAPCNDSNYVYPTQYAFVSCIL